MEKSKENEMRKRGNSSKKEEKKQNEIQNQDKKTQETTSQSQDDHRSSSSAIPIVCALLTIGVCLFITSGIAVQFIRNQNQPKHQHHFSSFFDNEQRTQDQSIRLSVPLEDVYHGSTVQFEKNRVVNCNQCDGDGIRPDVDLKPCGECKGEGFIRKTQTIGHMTYQHRSECPVCRGVGYNIKESDKCPSCKGHGRKRVKESLDLKIPKGLIEGSQLIIEGKSDELPHVKTGNLIVFVNTEEHPFFKRKDDIHLEFTAEISLLESLTGFKRKVKLLDGELFVIRREDITSHGEVIEFKGKGMPIMNSNGEYGNLYMNIKVLFPSSLSKEQLKTVQQLLADS